jgi:hypothetical protein
MLSPRPANARRGWRAAPGEGVPRDRTPLTLVRCANLSLSPRSRGEGKNTPCAKTSGGKPPWQGGAAKPRGSEVRAGGPGFVQRILGFFVRSTKNSRSRGDRKHIGGAQVLHRKTSGFSCALRNKKSPQRRTAPGFCSLPHVGCGRIVKEALAIVHAAVQNETGRYNNPGTGPWTRSPRQAAAGSASIPSAASTAAAAVSPDSQPPSMNPWVSGAQCSPAKCSPPTDSSIAPRKVVQSPGPKQA